MAGFYSPVLTAVRTTEPHFESLVKLLQALDPTAGPQRVGPLAWIIKKNSAWTAPHIAAAQNVLNTAPAASPQLAAQSTIDAWPIELKAAFVLVKERVNVLSLALNALGATPPLPTFTDQDFLAAIRAKAGTV